MDKPLDLSQEQRLDQLEADLPRQVKEMADSIDKQAKRNYIDGTLTWHYRCQCGAWGTTIGKAKAQVWINRHFANKHDGGKGLVSISATAWPRGRRNEGYGISETRIVR